MTVHAGAETAQSSAGGSLRIRVVKGNNLVKHDRLSHSDPYVVVETGKQTIGKTSVRNNNSNPTWNEDFPLSLEDAPIKLTMYDKDVFKDDKMGHAEVDIKPLLHCSKKEQQGRRNGTIVDRVQPSRNSCLANESCIVWENGKLTQDMTLKLRNAKHGELEIQLEWLGRSS